MASDLAEALSTTEALIGAAVALGAETVPEVSKAEQALIARHGSRRPAQAEVRALRSAIRDGLDPLGDAFCRLRSPTERRGDGATYTPLPIVGAMVEWAVSGPTPSRIIDPGAGSARFAMAAGAAFKQAEIIAVELDPMAALVSRANLAVRHPDRARVLVTDYRKFSPPADQGRTLWLGNPPYVRHHQIDPTWKHWLTSAAASLGHNASQLAGLHVYFFLATVLSARPGDRGAFITASEWLDVNYGELVRNLVLDGLGGQGIHVVAPEVQPFEDAQTTAAITTFEIGSKPSSLRLRRVKSVDQLKGLEGGQPVRRERLAEARRWSPLLRTARKPPVGYVELGEFCRVHRGTVTGHNATWIVDPAETDLPDSVLFPSVTRARELFAAGDILRSAKALRSVISLPADLDALAQEDRKPVERFIRRAKRLGVDQGYVARHRPAWWAVHLRAPAPILATYMARQAPAIVRNLPKARHINIAHGLYPRESLTRPQLDALADAVRESVYVGAGRTYAGGLTKFEPRELERLLIPDITSEPLTTAKAA